MVKFSHRHIHFYLKHLILLYKSSRLQMFFKIGILKNSQENTCLRVSFYSCRPQGKNIFKQNLFASSPVILSKEILAQVFSYEHRKISKNDNFFIEHPWWLALPIKLKMVELIISMNSQSIEQVAVYAGKLLFNFKNASLKPTMIVPQIVISNIF